MFVILILGFSSKIKTWLPVNPNYWRLNVAAQKSDSNSFLHVFKALSKLRKTRIGKYGNFDSHVLSNWVFAFTRYVLQKILQQKFYNLCLF